jgi:dTDP-4-amino-4,6-dideoxygalactose transaminase
VKEIPVANPVIMEEDAKAVYETVRAGWVSMGRKVAEFEEKFAAYVGVRHAIAVNSGTSAVHLILCAAGIGPGDEVIVPSLTFISSANAVLYERANVVLCECDPATYNARVEDIEPRITPKTKLIMPVDMNGLVVDYGAIVALGKKHGIPVLGDSAESLGATYKGVKVGSQAWAHMFSFFPNKNVTTGEGGMITTNDDALAKELRILRNQGQDYRYHHIRLGYNYRMTDIQATLGIVQLSRIDKVLAEKDRLAKRYTEAFKNDPIIKAPVVPPFVTQHSWYMYAISLPDNVDRDAVVADLKADGIDTRLSFPPIHGQPYYQERFGYTNESLPVTQRAWNQLIDIPIWYGLKEDQQDFVIERLRHSASQRSRGVAAKR